MSHILVRGYGARGQMKLFTTSGVLQSAFIIVIYLSFKICLGVGGMLLVTGRCWKIIYSVYVCVFFVTTGMHIYYMDAYQTEREMISILLKGSTTVIEAFCTVS